jgi:hypothetical protein
MNQHAKTRDYRQQKRRREYLEKRVREVNKEVACPQNLAMHLRQETERILKTEITLRVAETIRSGSPPNLPVKSDAGCIDELPSCSQCNARRLKKAWDEIDQGRFVKVELIHYDVKPRIVGEATQEHSLSGGLVTIGVWPGIGQCEILATLCHELAHIVVPGGHHSQWKKIFSKIVEQTYNVKLREPASRSSYDLDTVVELALAKIDYNPLFGWSISGEWYGHPQCHPTAATSAKDLAPS